MFLNLAKPGRGKPPDIGNRLIGNRQTSWSVAELARVQTALNNALNLENSATSGEKIRRQPPNWRSHSDNFVGRQGSDGSSPPRTPGTHRAFLLVPESGTDASDMAAAFSTTRFSTPPKTGDKYAARSSNYCLRFALATDECPIGSRWIYGTTRVAQAFRAGVPGNWRTIFRPVRGVRECYLSTAVRTRLCSPDRPSERAAPDDGWFTETTVVGQATVTGQRLFCFGRAQKAWASHNTRKLDAIRQEIDRLSLRVWKGPGNYQSHSGARPGRQHAGHFVSYLKDLVAAFV